MPEHIHYEDDELFNPDTHHEESDVPIKPLFVAVAIFIAFAFVTHFAIAAMYEAFVKTERKRMEPPQTQVARPADASVPQNQPLLEPFPRAETTPNTDTPVTHLDDLRRAEHEKLITYGWVDQQRGVARIPIDVAKEKLLRGAPAAPPAPTGAQP